MGNLPFERLDRTIVVRREAETSEKFGRDPATQTVAELLERGIIVIDKPGGPTSHQAADYAKKILGIPKAGHSGTLDPQVTGVLPIALGKGTRVVRALLNAGKEYVCVMHIHAERSEEEVTAALDSFVGKIKQLPPIKSAIKRQWRFRKIYYIEYLGMEEQDVLFIVGCQAGTYIRKLCHDLGEKLGCGAHMAELRRSKAGPFTEEDAINLHDLTDAKHYYDSGDEEALRAILFPIEAGVAHLAKIWVLDSTVDALCHGVSLKAPGIAKAESDIQVDDPVAVMTLKNELVLVGKSSMITKDLINADKGIAVRADQVFMQVGTYPKNQ